MRISDWSADVALPIFREEVGNCEHQSDKDGKEYPPGLPGRKVEHGLTTGLIVGRAAARWPNVGKRALHRANAGVGGDLHLHFLLVHFGRLADRSEEHTSELQSLMLNSYAVFCFKTKNR